MSSIKAGSGAAKKKERNGAPIPAAEADISSPIYPTQR
jgi:hypothetical protein